MMKRPLPGFAGFIAIAGIVMHPAYAKGAKKYLELTAPVAESAAGVSAATIPLDDTGIASWDYVNPRNPPFVDFDKATIAFANRTADRTFVVTMPDEKPFPLTKCIGVTNPAGAAQSKKKDAAGGVLYEVYLRVPPGAPSAIAPCVLQSVAEARKPENKNLVLHFKVAFFDEDGDPSNPNAYLKTVPKASDVTEPDGVMKWGVVASIGGTKDPDFDPDGDGNSTISTTVPYDSAERQRYPATGRLNLAGNLGNRADAEIELTYKNGDLGEKDSKRLTEATKYRVGVYSLYGLSLNFGKFAFAAPSRSIAVKETGEGFRLNYRWVGLSHIVRRESAAGVSNEENDDSDVTFLQLNNLAFGQDAGPLRSVSAIALRGRERLPAQAHSYDTVGADLAYAFPRSHIQGSLAYYRSRRETSAGSSVLDGSGSSGILTGSWSHVNSSTSGNQLLRSVGLLLGYGTGDKASTTTKDEGYLGETAAFAPDALFLNSIAGHIDTTGNGVVGTGLSNKRYVGLTYNEQTFSFLQWIAQMLRVPKEDIASKGTILKFHWYGLNEPVFGNKTAGRECDLEFQIETPKGVKVTLGGAKFFPGGALDSIFQSDPWTIYSTVSVKM